MLCTFVQQVLIQEKRPPAEGMKMVYWAMCDAVSTPCCMLLVSSTLMWLVICASTPCFCDTNIFHAWSPPEQWISIFLVLPSLLYFAVDKPSSIDANNQGPIHLDFPHFCQFCTLGEMIQHCLHRPSNWHRSVRHPRWGWLYGHSFQMHVVFVHYPQEILMSRWTSWQRDYIHPHMAMVGPVDRRCES